MISYLAVNLNSLLVWVNSAAHEARDKVKKYGRSARPSTNELRRIRIVLASLEQHCTAYGMRSSFDYCSGVLRGLKRNRKDCFWSDIAYGLEGLRNAIMLELLELNFAFIPREKTEFFEQEALFGVQVNSRFQSAIQDIRDAGNCLAADLHTAAVFHLMRVVEIGLRELALKLKVKFPKTPLNYVGWNAVVKAIDEKLNSRIPSARGPKQVKALQFKSDLLADFKSFEITRNEIMHCRWRCNASEAMGVFIRVKEFMQRLERALSK
jgi:hypothetical protein